MPNDESFDSLIKFRCYKELVARTERLAKRAKRNHPDWLRLAMEDHATEQEKALGLSPITEQEIGLYLGRLPASRASQPDRPKPQRPYRKKKN